jgi:hypothetical protein
MHGVASAGARVVLSQPLAQSVRFHAHDGIPLLIEVFGPSENFYRDVVFLELLRFASKIFSAEIIEQGADIRARFKQTRLPNCSQFLASRSQARLPFTTWFVHLPVLPGQYNTKRTLFEHWRNTIDNIKSSESVTPLAFYSGSRYS